jgi:prephenate dehydrogenase
MAARLKIGKLVVIGVGLIGGSFALALRRARAVARVVGVGRTRANLAAALRLKVIDEAAHDPARAVRDADLVLLATPVGQMPSVMSAIAPHLRPRGDHGRGQQSATPSLRAALSGAPLQFVLGYPVAGTERAARPPLRLFENRNVILTPQREPPRARSPGPARVRPAGRAPAPRWRHDDPSRR